MGIYFILYFNFKSGDESNFAGSQQIFIAQLYCFASEINILADIRSRARTGSEKDL